MTGTQEVGAITFVKKDLLNLRAMSSVSREVECVLDAVSTLLNHTHGTMSYLGHKCGFQKPYSPRPLPPSLNSVHAL